MKNPKKMFEQWLERYLAQSLFPACYKVAVRCGMTQIGEEGYIESVYKELKGDSDDA